MSIVWSRCLFDQPSPLARFAAPPVAGLYAILRRGRGATYSGSPWGEYELIALVETQNLALSLATERAGSLAGAPDDLYVAAYPMPDSGVAEREAFLRQLLATAPRRAPGRVTAA